MKECKHNFKSDKKTKSGYVCTICGKELPYIDCKTGGKAYKYTIRVQRDPIRSYTAFNMTEIWFEYWTNIGLTEREPNPFTGGYIYNDQGCAFKSDKPRNVDSEEIDISWEDMLVIKDYAEAKEKLKDISILKKTEATLEEKKERLEKEFKIQLK